MVLCMVVLGGMGNVAGVVLGAVLLTALPEALRHAAPLQQAWLGEVYIDPSDLRMLLFGAALVLMMLFRPAGLWPSSIRRRELAATREPAGAEGADVPR
jgi:branched-chain amino acid transport system permease protein